MTNPVILLGAKQTPLINTNINRKYQIKKLITEVMMKKKLVIALVILTLLAIAIFYFLTTGSIGTKYDTAEVKKGLEDAKALLKAAGIEADTSVLPGQPETALSKLVDEASFDMLVMGAYGHSRIRTLVIGSTTTEMVRSCKVPVVLMR